LVSVIILYATVCTTRTDFHATIDINNRINVTQSQDLFKVNFSLGAAEGPVFGELASSTIPDIGGLVARGDGTATGKPKAEADGPRLNPRFGKFGVVGGGLVAEVEGAAGAVPLLNSAHRGHLRLVSTYQGIR
jgi:hypothetical protein